MTGLGVNEFEDVGLGSFVRIDWGLWDWEQLETEFNWGQGIGTGE